MKKLSLIYQSILHLGLSRTARNTYAVSVGNTVSMVLGFVFIITLVRTLTLSEFGYFSALYALLLLVSDVADIGIGTSLSRFLPPLSGDKKKMYSFLKTAFILQLVIAFGVSVILLALSGLLELILFKNHLYGPLIQLISVGIFFAVISNFILYTLSAQQKFVKAAVYNSLGGSIRLVLLFSFILYHPLTLSLAVQIQVLSLIFLTVLGFFFIHIDFLKVKLSKENLGKLLRFTSYLGMARSVTAVAGKLDVLMLVSLTSSTEAGIFATASRVIGVYPLFAGSFSTVVAPKLAQIQNKVDLYALIKKIIIGTLVLISTVLVLIFFAHPFMTILFGEKASVSVPVFQLLLVSMIFFVGSVPSVSLIIYYLHKPQILTINSILQVIIVIVGNLFFIPRFGRFGPAISLILAYGITFALTSYLSFYYLKKKHE